MMVTSAHVLIDASGKRRGRLCQRKDGRWQFVTERLAEETGEILAYWVNDYPPSGIFENANEAAVALRSHLGEPVLLERIEPCTFDTDVGPFPEPKLRSA